MFPEFCGKEKNSEKQEVRHERSKTAATRKAIFLPSQNRFFWQHEIAQKDFERMHQHSTFMTKTSIVKTLSHTRVPVMIPKTY